MKTLTTALAWRTRGQVGFLSHWICGLGEAMGGGLRRCLPAIFCAALATSASAQTEQVIASLGGKRGDLPESNGSTLVLPNGHVIGTAAHGGSKVDSGLGVVFEAIPPTTTTSGWSYHVIYRFQGGQDGASPLNGLTRGKDGVLYGLTAWGGQENCGVVYQLMPPAKSGTGKWEETVLYTFQIDDVADGCKPDNTQLLFDKKTGSLYGTTELGGVGYGTFFRLDPPPSAGQGWSEDYRYEFSGGLDGGYPTGGLAGNPESIIYGTTQIGGYGAGVVWQYYTAGDANGEMATAYYFEGGADGATPQGGVIGPFPYSSESPDYYLLGTTAAGGGSANCSGGCGTVVAIDLPLLVGQIGTDSILHAFQGTDGDEPVSGLAMIGGAAWGTTASGGGSANCGGFGCGTLFEIQLSDVVNHIHLTYVPVYNFQGGDNDGGFPETGLAGDSSGDVFGMTAIGGTSNGGTLFEYVP